MSSPRRYTPEDAEVAIRALERIASGTCPVAGCMDQSRMCSACHASRALATIREGAECRCPVGPERNRCEKHGVTFCAASRPGEAPKPVPQLGIRWPKCGHVELVEGCADCTAFSAGEAKATGEVAKKCAGNCALYCPACDRTHICAACLNRSTRPGTEPVR